MPPTVALTADNFGRERVGIVFGWVFAAHQFGAAFAAWAGGASRGWFGTYTYAFVSAGALCLLAAGLSLRIGKQDRPALALQTRPRILTRVHRLFQRQGAGRPPRVRWALEEVGAPYEYVVMTKENGLLDEHRSRHPLGRVPVFDCDEGQLIESAAICLHIADLHRRPV